METVENNYGSTSYPPKPVLVERNSNNLTRSLISLFIYALLFYFLFDRNIAYIAAVLLVLLIHEFGHFFAMKIYNYQNVKLFIIPLLGAMVTGKKQTVSQKQMSIIVLAGPFPGMVMGFVLYYINHFFQNDSIKLLANTFVFINLFNLLPIYPLDGGRFLENLFLKNNFVIRVVFTIISVFGLIILIILSGNFIMLLVPGIMIFELYNEIKNQKIREYLDQEKIGYKTEYVSLADRSYWLIRDCILFSFQKKYAAVKPGFYQYSVMESMLLHHVTTILKADFKDDLSSFQKGAFLFIYFLFLIILPVIAVVLMY